MKELYGTTTKKKQSIKLSEVLTNSLDELIQKMDLIDMKVHTDDSGCVCCIELKYIPKENEV